MAQASPASQGGVRDSDATSVSIGGSGGPSSRADQHSTGDFSETRSIRLEWQVDNLRALFNESKGEGVKSKCIKSALFGDGAWQVYLYANSGSEPAYVSLYLSAEPTREERERGATAQPSAKEWTRDGTYRFLFEVKMLGHIVKAMEAQDHAFDSASRNWGWASFFKRADFLARLNHAGVDSFVISCTITCSPSPPTQPPDARAPRKQLVPSTLVDAYATLFNDPALSDVVFVFPAISAGRSGSRRTRRLYASKKILSSRSEYFRDAFSGAWADMDDEDEDEDGEDDGASDAESDATVDEDGLDDDLDVDASAFGADTSRGSLSRAAPDSVAGGDETLVDVDHMKTSTVPSSPIERGGTPMRVASLETTADVFMSPMLNPPASSMRPPPPSHRRRRPVRTRVVVSDTSFRTYRALLFYLFTDRIRFAPLASIYADRRETALANGETWPWTSRSDWSRSLTSSSPSSDLGSSLPPCADVKAIYAVADKIMLPELKRLAFEHIKRSLSPSIVAYEAFSTFSARFPEVQQFQVQILLQNWSIVRTSPAMRKVFGMLASGQGTWSGFQEVWFSILTQLEYRSVSPAVATGVAPALTE